MFITHQISIKFIAVTIFCVAIPLYAELVDFGERGNTVVIAEPSLKEQFNSSIRDFNASQKQKDFKDSIYKAGDGKLNLPDCEKNATRILYPTKILSKNYFTPDGRILAKKGDVYNFLKKTIGLFTPKMIILNANDEPQVEYIKKICRTGECIVWLSNGNSFDFEKQTGLNGYPLPEVNAEILKAQCSLSIYDTKGDHFLITELAITKSTK